MNQTPATEDRVLEALARVPIFSQLDDRDRRKLAKLCTLKSFEAGDLLYEEGTMGLSLFIVTSGQVEIFRSSNGTKVGLGKVAVGGVLGQLALLDDRPRAASAEALETTECLLITRDSFDTLVKKEPEIAWCLTPGLAERIRDLQGLAMEAWLAQEEKEKEEAETAPAAEEPKAEEKAAKAEEEESDDSDGEDDDDEPSDLESALFKMMRMQYGIMAGTAKGMTETARVMEKFLDSMADETELKTNEDWGDLLGKIPEAMVTASRAAMDEAEKVPEEMVDAYRRYSDSDD
jgi:CRP-like cAMP-binding protein